MKMGERGRITIPKNIRDRFGLEPGAEIELRVENGSVILKRAPKRLNLEKWMGRCKSSLAAMGYASVDEFMEDTRGR
jgi:AbrB family looped-hinge helix DNA binding protein